MSKKQTGLQLAIAHVGSARKLGAALGVMPRTVKDWLAADENPNFPPSAVLSAVEAAGSQMALAAALGVTRMSVYIWLCQGYVPPARAKEIEMQFGIPRGDLVSAKVRSNLGLGGEL